MNVAELPIQIDQERIAEFCRVRGIRKLSAFGSVLRDDFDLTRSDVDVLVEFVPGVRPGLKFFGYGDELAEVMGHEVDFHTAAWLSEYFRDEVVREAVATYEQAVPEGDAVKDRRVRAAGTRVVCAKHLAGNHRRLARAAGS
jgi:hypothetical protein